MADELLTPTDLDELFRYPDGRSARLARHGLIPHVVLPDGSIRFKRETIEVMLCEALTQRPAGVPNEQR